MKFIFGRARLTKLQQLDISHSDEDTFHSIVMDTFDTACSTKVRMGGRYIPTCHTMDRHKYVCMEYTLYSFILLSLSLSYFTLVSRSLIKLYKGRQIPHIPSVPCTQYRGVARPHPLQPSPCAPKCRWKARIALPRSLAPSGPAAWFHPTYVRETS